MKFYGPMFCLEELATLHDLEDYATRYGNLLMERIWCHKIYSPTTKLLSLKLESELPNACCSPDGTICRVSYVLFDGRHGGHSASFEIEETGLRKDGLPKAQRFMEIVFEITKTADDPIPDSAIEKLHKYVERLRTKF